MKPWGVFFLLACLWAATSAVCFVPDMFNVMYTKSFSPNRPGLAVMCDGVLMTLEQWSKVPFPVYSKGDGFFTGTCWRSDHMSHKFAFCDGPHGALHPDLSHFLLLLNFARQVMEEDTANGKMAVKFCQEGNGWRTAVKPE